MLQDAAPQRDVRFRGTPGRAARLISGRGRWASSRTSSARACGSSSSIRTRAPGEAPASDASAPARSPRRARSPRGGNRFSAPASARSSVAMATEDFGAVYEEAGIELPAHGYGVDKVAEMLAGQAPGLAQPRGEGHRRLAALEAARCACSDVIAGRRCGATRRSTPSRRPRSASSRAAAAERGPRAGIAAEIDESCAQEQRRDRGLKKRRRRREKAFSPLQTASARRRSAARGRRPFRGRRREPHHRRLPTGRHDARLPGTKPSPLDS